MSPQVPEAQYNLVILNVVYIWNDNYKQINGILADFHEVTKAGNPMPLRALQLYSKISGAKM